MNSRLILRYFDLIYPLSFSSKCLCLHNNSFCHFSSNTKIAEKHLTSDLTIPVGNEIDTKYVPVLRKKTSNTSAFNIAAYVNESNTLQELVKLGVNLHKIECRKGAQEVILRLDFERDIKKYIQFLTDVGMNADDLGLFISKNPFIFKESLENLSVRINYLESKNFSQDNIVRIISKNPSWLSFETLKIDDRLGYFQDNFFLCGPEVRQLAIKMPKIITYDMKHINEVKFSVKEEMGFKTSEMKELLLKKPKIFTINRKNLIERFCYLNNVMGLDHKHLITQPGMLLCRQSKLRERHEFLVALDRAQYDPSKQGYISPLTAISCTDDEFSKSVCKVPISTYNKFLKTLC